VKDRAAAFIAFRTARIPPLSDATHVPSHGNLTQTFDFDPQKDARRELLVAAAQARKAATAALHNKRVNEQRSSAIRMKTTIEHYTRSTINRRLKEAEALRASRLRAKAIKAKAFLDRVDHVAERNDARKVRAPPRPAPTVAPPGSLPHARAIEPRALTSHRKSTRVF